MDREYIAVVGGVNVDITGSPFAELVPGDSNPGRVRSSYGGVGRNIAENLRRLGREVLFVTAVGGGMAAEGIRGNAKELGIRLSGLSLPEENCSTYLCLNGRDGNVVAAIADMDILDRLTPQALAPFVPELNRARAVIADANLPAESLTYLAGVLSVPLICDPVSVSKAPRLKGALKGMSALKPNRAETAVLIGLKTDSPEEIAAAAERLLSMGVERVFLSLGGEGVYYDDGKSRGFARCLPGKIVNTTGCGDAFLAAAADGFLRGLPIRECALRGLAASALCAEWNEGVCPRLSEAALDAKIRESQSPV